MHWHTPYFPRRTATAPKTTPSARPMLEALEDRTVPSYLAAEFPGHGVWLYNSAGGTWQQMTAANASQAAADSNGDVVGEFPGQGVWLCKNNTWQQINGNDASSLAISYSSLHTLHNGTFITISVAAQFPGYGLCLYNDSTNTFPNYHQTTGWTQLTANNASTEAVYTVYGNEVTVVAEFPGQGVWLTSNGSSGWEQLTAADATSLGCNSTDVVGEFPGHGVWRYQLDSPWQQLTASDATSVGMNANGAVVGEFAGHGVWSYSDAGAGGYAAGWNQLTAADAALVGIDAAGNVYGQFGAAGVWYDQVGSWQHLTASNASSFGVGG